MAAEASSPVPAQPAATVLLVRDGAAGLEVFMVVRHRDIAFAGGALVFPGGRVEEADAELAGGDPLGAYRIAGIRETFEECGVLLARPPGEADMIRSEEHTSELQSRQYLVCRLLLEKKKKKRTHTTR